MLNRFIRLIINFGGGESSRRKDMVYEIDRNHKDKKLITFFNSVANCGLPTFPSGRVNGNVCFQNLTSKLINNNNNTTSVFALFLTDFSH